MNSCKYCGKFGKDLKICSQCHNTKYCSQSCADNDWKTHKLTCEKEKKFNLQEMKNTDIKGRVKPFLFKWSTTNKTNDQLSKLIYSAISHKPDPFADKYLNISDFYGQVKGKAGLWFYNSPFYGKLEGQSRVTNRFKIAYTKFTGRRVSGASEGRIVLFLHGVPTNRRQWYPVAKMIARFARVVCIDMLGMGQSAKPQWYGLIDRNGKRIKNPNGTLKTEFTAWDWKNDPDYIHKFMVAQYGQGVKYVFVADDWGGGILSHHCEQYNDEVIAQILVDPIAFDGYPVREIMAIGRLAGIRFMKTDDASKDAMYMSLIASFDQTLTQIYKTMVYNPGKVYNQYTLRDIQFPYMDVNYHKKNANSLTMGLKPFPIQVLADRASRLGSPQLFPRTTANLTSGVNYSAMTMPTCVIWGILDNMMPDMQRFKFQQVMRNALVDTKPIQEAGHFVSTDQPHLVAEAILSFIIGRFGVHVLRQSFWGFKGRIKGDELTFVKPEFDRILAMENSN